MTCPGATVESEAPAPPLARFLRERKDEILTRWYAALRECSPAARLDEPALEDHLKQHLGDTLDAIEAIGSSEWSRIPTDGIERHALSRLAQGLEIDELVIEQFLLRHILTDFVRKQGRDDSSLAESINWAIDEALRASVKAFERTRHRTLEALDRLATIALQTRSVDALLDALLRLILDVAPNVHTVILLLLDGDVLRLRAAAGLEADVDRGFTLKLGEGFAGRVAESRTARAQPSFKSSFARASSVRRSAWPTPSRHSTPCTPTRPSGSPTSMRACTTRA